MSPCRIVFFLPMSTCRIIDFCRCHTARSIFLPMLPCQIVKKGSIPATVPSFSPTRSRSRSPTRSRTFRKNDLYPGRSPGKAQDLPGKWPLAWKVPRKSAGPSGKTAPGMEGPPEKRRTFRKNDPFPGRFPRWGGSRPPKVPFWWMAKARGGTGRHEATCHPRLGGACEAMALRRESRRGSPVLPWLAGSNKSRRVQQEQSGVAESQGARRAGAA